MWPYLLLGSTAEALKNFDPVLPICLQCSDESLMFFFFPSSEIELILTYRIVLINLEDYFFYYRIILRERVWFGGLFLWFYNSILITIVLSWDSIFQVIIKWVLIMWIWIQDELIFIRVLVWQKIWIEYFLIFTWII